MNNDSRKENPGMGPAVQSAMKRAYFKYFLEISVLEIDEHI